MADTAATSTAPARPPWRPTPKALFLLPLQGWRYFCEHGIAGSWKHINSREAHPFIQFCKYVTCGFAATFVLIGVSYALMYTVLPAFSGMTLANGDPVTDEIRERNNIYANAIAFIPSNFVAYFLNVAWVFEGGRHNRWKEFGLFTLISAISFFAGLFGGPKLIIGIFGLSTHLSQLSFMVTSALVNFVCRKFLIFAR
ncbi:MAG: GtrA family protein [Verrucomicrobiota bacterium]